MALLGHVSAEMTLRYASLASPTVRAAYEAAMSKATARMMLPIAPVGSPSSRPPIIPGRVGWLRSEMLKTRVAHGYCSRQLVADACPYANICEQCDNYVAAPEFNPQLEAQLADIHRSETTQPNADGTPKPPATNASSPASTATCND